jgi:hypothetical protein
MVEFIKDTHTYLVDGIIVPSVSTILKDTIFADKYKDVPDFVLRNAAEFGTAIHNAVEHESDEGLDETQYLVYSRYLKLKDECGINPIEQEQIIHHHFDYAGTFDMIAEINGEKCLVDIKTTYILDIEYLSWQLSLYAYAKQFDGKLYAIWLPKRKGAKLVEIPHKTHYEIHELLEVYHALQKDRNDDQAEW